VIAAGLARVVVAMTDPNQVVDGRGIAALRAAGIEVEVGLLEAEARKLNEKFIWSVTRGMPFVLVKAGMTLDGKLATVARESQWITSEPARDASLRLREEYDAILVGSGTVKADNPRLTRRLGLATDATQWTRIVLDGDGEIPPQAQILTDGGRTILFTSDPSRYAPSPNLEIVAREGLFDLVHVLGQLQARGIRSVIVEGGAIVHSEFLRGGLWQKLILFIAPLLVGGAEAPSIFSGEGVPRLTDAYRFRFDRVELLGNDLMVVAYPL
jgi:diaminohydroxyphosphoribosylaminopyrimidine deaminase/5-amino-6-(5-phosphoribosylamino)uracil reductase